MAATDDTVCMAREDGCACRSMDRTRQSLLWDEVGLRSKQGWRAWGMALPGARTSKQEANVSSSGQQSEQMRESVVRSCDLTCI